MNVVDFASKWMGIVPTPLQKKCLWAVEDTVTTVRPDHWGFPPVWLRLARGEGKTTVCQILAAWLACRILDTRFQGIPVYGRGPNIMLVTWYPEGLLDPIGRAVKGTGYLLTLTLPGRSILLRSEAGPLHVDVARSAQDLRGSLPPLILFDDAPRDKKEVQNLVDFGRSCPGPIFVGEHWEPWWE